MAQSINITEIQLFKALKQKLGEQEAEDLVTFVQSEVKAQTDQQSIIISKDIASLKDHIDTKFATKDDLHSMKVDIEKTFRQQFWLIVVLFLPLYLTMLAFILNIMKK